MKSTYIDGPIARGTLEHLTRPFHIYAFLVIALIGSGLFPVGAALGGLSWLDSATMPDATVMLLVGFVAFWCFFPMFLCLYCCRSLLLAVRDLEQKVERLKHDA